MNCTYSYRHDTWDADQTILEISSHIIICHITALKKKRRYSIRWQTPSVTHTSEHDSTEVTCHDQQMSISSCNYNNRLTVSQFTALHDNSLMNGALTLLSMTALSDLFSKDPELLSTCTRFPTSASGLFLASRNCASAALLAWLSDDNMLCSRASNVLLPAMVLVSSPTSQWQAFATV